MKPARYYALSTRMYGEVIAVTSEKGSRWFGRRVMDNSPTHGVQGNLRGRFETADAARAMKEQIFHITTRYNLQRDELNRQFSALCTSERDEIAELIEGATSV